MQFVNLRRTGCLGMYFWTSLAINVSTSRDLPTATATSIHDKVACVITAYYIWEEIADRTSLNLMSLFQSPLGPFFGELVLCYGKSWNCFWKYMSGEVCTYLSLDHPCIGGLFQGPYISLSLKYFLWFTAVSRAFFRLFLVSDVIILIDMIPNL